MDKDTSLAADVAAERVIRMATPALQRLHRFLFGKDCTVTHLLYLRRPLAFELQGRAAGGSARAVAPDPVSAGGRRQTPGDRVCRPRHRSEVVVGRTGGTPEPPEEGSSPGNWFRTHGARPRRKREVTEIVKCSLDTLRYDHHQLAGPLKFVTLPAGCRS